MRRRELLVVAAAAAWSVIALRAQPAPRVIPIVARRFVFLPAQIHVRLGESVVLEFSEPEVVMGFYAPALKLRTVIVPGQTTRLAWQAEQPRRFDFLCDIFCGDGHEGMAGQLIVDA